MLRPAACHGLLIVPHESSHNSRQDKRINEAYGSFRQVHFARPSGMSRCVRAIQLNTQEYADENDSQWCKKVKR